MALQLSYQKAWQAYLEMNGFWTEMPSLPTAWKSVFWCQDLIKPDWAHTKVLGQKQTPWKLCCFGFLAAAGAPNSPRNLRSLSKARTSEHSSHMSNPLLLSITTFYLQSLHHFRVNYPCTLRYLSLKTIIMQTENSSWSAGLHFAAPSPVDKRFDFCKSAGGRHQTVQCCHLSQNQWRN